jgi:Putative 2OG-Fe(II) oxygenase
MLSAAADFTDLTQLLESCRLKPLVFDGVRPELCPRLAEIILGRMQRDHGRRVGSINVGGWKSGEDFFMWPDGAVQELRQVLVEAVGARSLVGWAMVNRAGSQHPRHQHRVASLTGIYYVAAGSAEAITPTVFECPCDSRLVRGGTRHELEVEPHPGRLVVCRGETWHRVPRYPGDLPRITIAFDVRR